MPGEGNTEGICNDEAGEGKPPMPCAMEGPDAGPDAIHSTPAVESETGRPPGLPAAVDARTLVGDTAEVGPDAAGNDTGGSKRSGSGLP